jgi:hypothetical protein
MSETSCDCFVARHQHAGEIDAALRGGEDPRAVAARFGIGKSRVYEHRKHLLGDGPTPAARPSPEPARPLPMAPVERSMEPVERVERRVEPGGTSGAKAPVTPRALPVAEVPKSPYASAVAEALELVSVGQWRAHHVPDLAQRFGLARNTVRTAYNEAIRHLQLDMGGYLAKQATSAAYVVRERDEAKAESRRAKEHAERWRKQEREAQEEADKLEGKERIAALETAARFGLLATKYDLSAEKWSAQALAHQRHLDDVLCLRMPKEVSATQINLGGDGSAKLEEFAGALAARLRGRPDLLAEIDAAAEAVERGQDPGDAAAIVTTAEAA